MSRVTAWLKATTRRIRAAVSELTTAKNPANWLVDWIRGGESDAGIPLDGKTILKYAPVWYAVNRICGNVAQLPLLLKEQVSDRETRRAVKHPVWKLLKQRPNALMTPATFKELLQYHALVFGNGRALIVRNNRRVPIGLIPMLPDRTVTVLDDANEKWHVTKPSGVGEARRFRDADVLHIAGLGFDGLEGYPLHEFANNSLGLGLATEKHGNRFFKHNAMIGVILEVPEGKLTDQTEAESFLKKFKSLHEGADNAFRVAMLRDGITAKTLSQTGQDAQWIDQRKFQRQEVALWFLLESILGDDASVSYNSLEQKQLAFLVNCLNTWLVKWQEQCDLKLLTDAEREGERFFSEFNTGALLRSDTNTTYTNLTLAVRGMIMTPNEARQILDLPPADGGDELQNPAITVKQPTDQTTTTAGANTHG